VAAVEDPVMDAGFGESGAVEADVDRTVLR
jgi:hypothetical protein